MLKILLHRFFRDVAGAPRAVPNGPEVPPPVLLPQVGVHLLEQPRRAPLHPLDQIGHGLRRRVLDVHVDMIFADHAFEYPHILGIADLHQQIAAPHFDVAHEHMLAVLRHPHVVRRQPCDRVSAVSVLSHARCCTRQHPAWKVCSS